MFRCSTNPQSIQLDRLNEALASDALWWAKELPKDALQAMVQNSLCFGLYKVSEVHSQDQTGELTMIGLSRVITDHVTFGWLTDVYVLEEHQRKGLARFMMECLDEVLNDLPHLRRLLILSRDDGAMRIYRSALSAKDWQPPEGTKFLAKVGSSKKPAFAEPSIVGNQT
ncbi:hypothetical protein MCOR02_005854 [Pyricularia oryzae]|nr:hypothetical protein MCOR02_005854 [Pyricularia oryzae]KAI6284874.1 hypothetical protein MCOR26_001770 [Pyricularia oryzae]KAI6305168.1 hypothetical protein MCOR29_010607 [Pyricularia oryzae]KAI6345716.1 hypothetical protein MCOR28_003382 [Pyricularia oryzae]KAI6376640.1 hypothetical protein MCOR31_001642 [Pyricularia oryzae]